MEKLLEIIVPVYGKDPLLIYEGLSAFEKVNDDRVHMTIVYKNDSSFNYDNLKKLSSKNIDVFKGESEFKKTKKVLLGIEKSESKYIVVMDAHHELKYNKLTKFLDKLENKKADLIRTVPILKDMDKGTSKKRYANGLTAGRYIISRKTMIFDEHLIDYDIIFYDDWTVGLYSLFRGNSKIKYIFKDFYQINTSDAISQTRGKKNKETSLKIADDVSQMIRFYLNNDLFDINKNNKKFLINYFKMFKAAFEEYCRYYDLNPSKCNDEEREKIFKIIFEDNVDENINRLYPLRWKLFNPFYKINYYIFKRSDKKNRN